MPRQCDCHFTDVFTLISLYKAFVFSFTIQFETWRLFCLRYNHRAQVIYCGPNIMTAILQTNLKCIFLHGNCCTFLEISFKFENTLDNLVNDAFKYFSWMETFAVFIQISFFIPPPLGAGGIMFSGCPSVRPKPEIPSFDMYMGPLVHPTNRNRFTACPSVRPSVRLSVRPSGEVSGHLPENVWREWPEILHADVSWPSSELISLWPRSVDFCNFGAILT